MPKFQIIKTIQIHKKADAVFKYINDFHFWPKWSPWLIVEPQTHVEVQQDGKYFLGREKSPEAAPCALKRNKKTKPSFVTSNFLNLGNQKRKLPFI